jgi:hypothetical protein
MKIRPLGAELFHAERYTDMQLVVIFRDFANAPKKGTHVPLCLSNLAQYQQLIRLSDSVKRKMETMTCMIRIPSDCNTQGSER